MTTPQDPPVRNRQKKRRTKQLAAWRAKHPKAEAPAGKAPDNKVDKKAPAKAAAPDRKASKAK